MKEKITRLAKLDSWFINYFDKQLNQSLWQIDFKPSYDKYFNKSYSDITELKVQAQLVRDEIKKLNIELKPILDVLAKLNETTNQ